MGLSQILAAFFGNCFGKALSKFFKVFGAFAPSSKTGPESPLGLWTCPQASPTAWDLARKLSQARGLPQGSPWLVLVPWASP